MSTDMVPDSYWQWLVEQEKFTQEDAFELDGCGVSCSKRLVWRRFMRRMPEVVKLIAAMKGYEVKG